MATTITIESGRIAVRTEYKLRELAKAIPGWYWDHPRVPKAWSWPASQMTAIQIWDAFGRHARGVAPEFSLLCPRSAAPPTDGFASASECHVSLEDLGSTGDVPGADAVTQPPGIRTPLWAHQRAGIAFADGKRGVLLAWGMGCVAGDSIVHSLRHGKSKKQTVRHLFRLLNDPSPQMKSKLKCGATKVRSLCGEELRQHECRAVIFKGHQKVVLVKTQSGKSIRVTPDHEFIKEDGSWVAAERLRAGDHLLVNGRHELTCPSCKKKRTVKNHPGKGNANRLCVACAHPRNKISIVDKDGYVRLYGYWGHPRSNAAGQVYEHIIVMERHTGKPIPSGHHIHHKNHDRTDNRVENLEILSPSDHHKKHSQHRNFHNSRGHRGGIYKFIPEIDVVKSVEPDGISDVYDLVMADPHRNFVANGFIVHNCGKTLGAASLIAERQPRTILILGPTSALPVWPAQMKIHCENPFHIVQLDESIGTNKKKTELVDHEWRVAALSNSPIVVVVNYESARMNPLRTWILRRTWDLVVADECHRARSPGSQTSFFMRTLGVRSGMRLGLSGTPMPHSPLDVYGVYRFLDSSIFGTSYAAFEGRFAIKGGHGNHQVLGYKNLDELKAGFCQIAHRVRTRDVVDLPETQTSVRTCKMGKDAARIYRELDREFCAEVKGGLVTVANAMVKVLRLQQVTSGVTRREGESTDVRVDDAKMRLLEDVLEDLDEPVVVACHFHSDLDAVHAVAERLGRRSIELSGRRKEVGAKWEGDATVLAAQITSGSEGVDLTRARVLVIYSSGCVSPGTFDQMLARVHRPGQTRGVLFIHLLVAGSVDERVHEARAARRDVIESVVDAARRL